MSDSRIKKFLYAALTTLLSGLELPKSVKIPATFLSELYSRFGDLPESQKDVVAGIPIDDLKAAIRQIEFATKHAADSAAKTTRIEQKIDEISAAIRDVCESDIDPPLNVESRYFDVPFKRHPCLAGRHQTIIDLRRAFRRRNGKVQVVRGLGGIGKTQLAVEYAYRYRDRYAFVFWANCSSETSIKKSYREIGLKLGIESTDEVMAWLSSNSDCLLICDSADDPKALSSYLPNEIAGHALITSRARSFDSIVVLKPVELLKLPQDECVKFLLKRCDRDDDDESEIASAMAIADELDGLPLALEQAAAYICAMEVRYVDYLDAYRRLHLDLLERRGPVIGDYPASVATAWTLNVREIEASSPASADTLRVCAFFGSVPIPFAVFRVFGFTDKLAVECFIDFLMPIPRPRSYYTLKVLALLESLTRFSLVSVAPTGSTFSVHPLLQEAMRYAMTKEEHVDWAKTALKVLLVWHTEVIEREDRLEMLPHALEFAERVESYGLRAVDVSELLFRIASSLYLRLGKSTDAKRLVEKALSIGRREISAENVEMNTVLSRAADCFREMNDYDRAEKLYLQALSRPDDLPEESVHTRLGIIVGLGGVYREMGRYQAAERLFGSVIDAARDSREDEPSTYGDVLAEMIWLHDEDGEYSKLELLCDEVLAEVNFFDDRLSIAVLGAAAKGFVTLGRETDARILLEYVSRLEKPLYFFEDSP